MTAPDYQTPARMAAKLAAVPLPDMAGLSVLDVGCDMGAWCRLAAERGARDVLGLDRNRLVRGRGMVDLVAENRASAGPPCRFERLDLGRQWREFGRFDLVLLLSVYHHAYEAAGGDHAPVWFWLWRHVKHGGALLWEGPLDTGDPVVRANVSADRQRGYTRDAILGAAARWFEAERIGPALHEPTREVWRFRPRALVKTTVGAEMVTGAGGATRAFEYAAGRRAREVEHALGFAPWPGSLNLRLGQPFDWDAGYYRAQVLDVRDRSQGFDGDWQPRWARFYPLTLDGRPAWAMRFEGESYGRAFVELIAPERLRDRVAGPMAALCRSI